MTGPSTSATFVYDADGNRVLATVNGETTIYIAGQYHGSGLIGTERLYCYLALGRFMQADTLVPEPGNPQALNRYAYVYNNPARYTDSSRHAAPIDVAGYLRVHPRTGNIIVAGIAGSGLRQLIAFAALGRDTADQWLADILERTASTGQLPNALSFLDSLAGKATRTHFASTGAIRGDSGFAREYGDDYLYGQLWGFKTPETKQTGHFLTAVDMGYQGSWVRSIVGHEQIGDQWGPLVQVISPSKQDLLAFEMALIADAAGATAVRDTNLGYILNSGQDGLGKRRGNSMEDLRLSVRGWRLGNMVSTGQLGTNKDLANWIALNVAGD